MRYFSSITAKLSILTNLAFCGSILFAGRLLAMDDFTFYLNDITVLDNALNGVKS